MKLASCTMQGRTTYGVVVNNDLQIPSDEFLKHHPDLKSVLAAGATQELLAAVGERVALDKLSFDPPVTHPEKILAVGMNYMVHIKEMGREPPDYPAVFIRYPDSLVGHGQLLVRPRVSEQYDYEGELAVIIGKPARYVDAAEALSYVAGYTCLNDGSIRDFQRHGSQFTPGKNFPCSGACGPWMVTADEIPDPSVLELTTRLNGAVVQQSPISDMRFSVPDIIAYCSTFTTLQPGDIITTGTPGGVGAGRSPQVWLREGDRVSVEINGIGVLKNEVADEPI
ncbi:MAG: fumarylacetoacetate hydrolase family protein [Chromatiales bacterium]|jgi:2-keto-4-pentenoate hydratase/2-oxohepta-3-ene-1,7-dioic acid hydratase in catechol pathway|nr:fumarylacetoacetate hydrolase family protein [Chromatiales bacterium]